MADGGSRAERFRGIYEAHHHRILGYALRRVEMPEDAADEVRLDLIAEAFAEVIDAKSPYTASHSEGDRKSVV